MLFSTPPQKLSPPEHSWHALSASEVLRELGSREEGLPPYEVENRQVQYGNNAFTEEKQATLFLAFVKQLKSPLAIILLLSCVVTIALDEIVDAVVILFALCLALVVGVVQEGRASRAFQRLSKSQTHTALVLRGGVRHELSASLLVPGDVIVLQSGMQVPADVRLLTARRLMINEAPLTGEWLAVEKQTNVIDVGTALADRSNMAWKGTLVSEGYGSGVVVATGDHTEVGKLAQQLKDIESAPTPLQLQMRKISRIMFLVITVLVVAIFTIGLLRGEPLESMLIMAIAIAVASVPEGLPAAVTIVLAISMEALLNRGGLVRNLLAAETLGSTTFILTDKTGTLTEGRMAVVDAVYVGASGNSPWQKQQVARDMLHTAVAATDAFIETTEGGKDAEQSYVVRGEALERAVLHCALESGVSIIGGSGSEARIDYLSFTSENRFAAGLVTYGEHARLCINGAPEYLLAAAGFVHTQTGVMPITSQQRDFFMQQIKMLTGEGKRLIAVVYKDTDETTIAEEQEVILQDTVFMGLLVFHDPIRADVAQAIDEAMKAGVTVRLVTGDNPDTALSIARAVGIAQEGDTALVGNDIAQLDDEALYDALQTHRVFARVLPKQKLRLAQVLQKNGEMVAMTGDGVNDAPALQKANIGVSLGSGTEVAKEASDLVLVHDTFTTLRDAIEEGRRIVSNLQKIVGYLLSTCLCEAVLIGGALLAGAAVPIVPVQILWANLIEEGFMSVAFAFEPGNKSAMKERPQNILKEGILSKAMLEFIGLVVCILSVFLLALYAFLLYIDMPLPQLRSVMFLVVAMDSLFIAFSFRALKVPVWRIPFWANKFFIGAFAVNLLLLLCVLAIPPLQQLLSYEPLPLAYVVLVVGYGLASMLVIELAKWVFFERHS